MNHMKCIPYAAYQPESVLREPTKGRNSGYILKDWDTFDFSILIFDPVYQTTLEGPKD